MAEASKLFSDTGQHCLHSLRPLPGVKMYALAAPLAGVTLLHITSPLGQSRLTALLHYCTIAPRDNEGSRPLLCGHAGLWPGLGAGGTPAVGENGCYQ